MFAGPVLLMIGLARTEASAASLLLTLEGAATALIAWFIVHVGFPGYGVSLALFILAHRHPPSLDKHRNSRTSRSYWLMFRGWVGARPNVRRSCRVQAGR